MSVASKVFTDAKIPFYVGADSMVADGGLATYGINYESLGAETAKNGGGSAGQRGSCFHAGAGDG